MKTTKLIILLVAIILISFNTAEATREYARDKACFSNQRVILGAVEMYNMDCKECMDEINPENIQILLKGKYLKSEPTHPERQCEYFGERLTSDGCIYCPYHGDVEKHLVHGQLAPYWVEREENRKEKERYDLIKYISTLAIVCGIVMLGSSFIAKKS